MATTAMSSASNDWYSRMQKKRDAELSLLRRPSETESQSISSSDHNTTTSTTNTSPATPVSPKSCRSNTTSSIRSFDQIQALQHQLKLNTAQIEANEGRIGELRDFDTRMSENISDRLSYVRDINESLRSLHEMLARTEKVAVELGFERSGRMRSSD